MQPEKSSKKEEPARDRRASIYVILYKLLLGVFETCAGLAIAFLGPRIYELYQASMIKELSEDPHDVLARLSESIVPNILTHGSFVVLYLLALGLAKVAGAIGLIYGQDWGVDVLVGLTIVLAPFQIANLLLHPHLFDFIYFATGILIALYLVEFDPKAWISRVVLRAR